MNINKDRFKREGGKHLPWVGKRYWDSSRKSLQGKRVLVLGVSHYADKEYDNPDFTDEVVRDFIERRRTFRFFTVAGKVLLLNRAARAEYTDVWNDVAFYNYVQALMEGPRRPPTPEQWADALKPMAEVWEGLKPELVLVSGQELWGNAIYFPHFRKLREDRQLAVIKHPAGGLRYEDAFRNWREILDDARASS